MEDRQLGKGVLGEMSSNFTVQQHRKGSHPLSSQLGSTAHRLG